MYLIWRSEKIIKFGDFCHFAPNFLRAKIYPNMVFNIHCMNMQEYGFSLDRILPYNDGIYDSIFISENTGQWKPAFSHISCSDTVLY